MKYKSKIRSSFLTLAFGLATLPLISGCGGGGSGSPSVPAVPTPFDSSYNATFVPSTKIASDGRAPTGSLSIVNGRTSLQTTFYLQPSVIVAVQKLIDDGLTKAGFPGAIADNQVPSTIEFTGTGQVDGSGKVTLISRQKVNICGNATLTIEPTFAPNGDSVGLTNYQITFPDNLVIELRGERSVNGTCNNLPLRAGTVSFTRP